jgi:hypothetical protein
VVEIWVGVSEIRHTVCHSGQTSDQSLGRRDPV